MTPDDHEALAEAVRARRTALLHRYAELEFSGPLICGDLPGYESPIDGRWIEGRAARREDLKRHNCVEYEPSERKYLEQRRREADQKLDAAIGETVERFIEQLPADKVEALAREIGAVP